MSDKNKISFDAENLAVPEVHTGEVVPEEVEEEEDELEIQFETLAVPEIKIPHI